MLRINRIMLDSIYNSFNLKNLLLIIIALSFVGASLFVKEFGSIHLFPFRIGLITFAFCLMIAILVKRGSFKLNIHVGSYLLFLALWFIYALGSYFWAPSLPNASLNIVYLFCNISIIVFVVVILTSIRDLEKLYYIWLIMLLISILIGLWNYKTGLHLSSSNLVNAPDYKRYVPTAFYYNQNDFGTYVAICIPFVISYTRHSISYLWKSAGIIMLSFSIFILLATKSRANLVGLLVGLLFWYFLMLNFRDKCKVAFLITAVIIASLVLICYFNYSNDLMQNTIQGLRCFTSETKDGSTVTRINLIKNSLTFLLNSYGFGVGAGNVEHYMASYAQFNVGTITNAHNWWMEILTNYGLIIFTGYVWLYISLCWNLYLAYFNINCKVEKMICEALLVGMVIFIFGSFSSSSVMAFSPQWLLIAFALAFLNLFRSSSMASTNK